MKSSKDGTWQTVILKGFKGAKNLWVNLISGPKCIDEGWTIGNEGQVMTLSKGSVVTRFEIIIPSGDSFFSATEIIPMGDACNAMLEAGQSMKMKEAPVFGAAPVIGANGRPIYAVVAAAPPKVQRLISPKKAATPSNKSSGREVSFMEPVEQLEGNFEFEVGEKHLDSANMVEPADWMQLLSYSLQLRLTSLMEILLMLLW
jgi:hypothetical protein